MALTAASFIPALRDPPLALARLDEALVVADAVGATSIANTVRSYRASHLAIAGRLEEAKAVLADLEGRLGPAYDAVRNNHDCMTAATWIVDKPERSVAALSSLHHAYGLAGFPYTIFRMFGAMAVASTGTRAGPGAWSKPRWPMPVAAAKLPCPTSSWPRPSWPGGAAKWGGPGAGSPPSATPGAAPPTSSPR